mgnify:FL=1
MDKKILSIYAMGMKDANWIEKTADHLAALYDQKFGGKENGRYRIPIKLVREFGGRRRFYEDDVRALARKLFECGFVLIDMDTFFVIMSANSFVNYRRANEDCVRSSK